jgi:nucleoside-diphosphate-sugar epimerase
MPSVLDQFSLRGKVALVTGGAGLYGRQIVRGLARQGQGVHRVPEHRTAGGCGPGAVRRGMGCDRIVLRIRGDNRFHPPAPGRDRGPDRADRLPRQQRRVTVPPAR